MGGGDTKKKRVRAFPYYYIHKMSGFFVRQYRSTFLFYHAVPVEVLSLQREVESTGNPQCFLSGSDVTLTCNVVGFPRPTIVFRNDQGDIMPGQAGFERVTNISFDQVYMYRYLCTYVMLHTGGDMLYTCMHDANV